ncbi:dihydropyrimidinase, partial [bacterium]|nr:dihydropyrimidinase [bacterium]
MNSLLIKNGRIITADDEFLADIYIEKGVIKSIGENLAQSADKEIDAADHLIFPGAVDAHVHLDLPVMGT